MFILSGLMTSQVNAAWQCSWMPSMSGIMQRVLPAVTNRWTLTIVPVITVVGIASFICYKKYCRRKQQRIAEECRRRHQEQSDQHEAENIMQGRELIRTLSEYIQIHVPTMTSNEVLRHRMRFEDPQYAEAEGEYQKYDNLEALLRNVIQFDHLNEQPEFSVMFALAQQHKVDGIPSDRQDLRGADRLQTAQLQQLLANAQGEEDSVAQYYYAVLLLKKACCQYATDHVEAIKQRLVQQYKERYDEARQRFCRLQARFSTIIPAEMTYEQLVPHQQAEQCNDEWQALGRAITNKLQESIIMRRGLEIMFYPGRPMSY